MAATKGLPKPGNGDTFTALIVEAFTAPPIDDWRIVTTGTHDVDTEYAVTHRLQTSGGGAFTLQFTNPLKGRRFRLALRVGASGANMTFPATVQWDGGAPPAFAANTTTVMEFVRDDILDWWIEVGRTVILPSTMPSTQFNQLDADRITNGVETLPRTIAAATGALTSQLLRVQYFTAYESMTVNSLVSYTGATAAGATPTLCKMGLYSVDSTGALTLIASTANDTTLWAAANTKYTRAVTAPVAVLAGRRYAFAALCVTAATAPALVAATVNTTLAAEGPRLTGALGGQADLPASVAAGGLGTSGVRIYGELQ